MVRHWFMSICTALLVQSVVAEPEIGPQEDRGSLNSAEHALQSAKFWLTGDRSDLLRTGADIAVAPAVEVHVDSTTAFVSDILDRRPSWRVQVFGLHSILEHDSIPNMVDSMLTCEILLDSLSGQLLTCGTTRQGVPDLGFVLPTASQAQGFLKMVGERYHGLPDVEPGIPLIQVLQEYRRYVLAATDVTIQYLLFTDYDHKTPLPVWVLFMRGDFDIGVSPGSSAASRGTWRIVIDAMSGELLSRSNTPQPVGD